MKANMVLNRDWGKVKKYGKRQTAKLRRRQGRAEIGAQRETGREPKEPTGR